LCFVMPKSINKKTNGNVFKTTVRGVVQEELKKTEQRLEKRLTRNLSEIIDEKFEENYTKYRDDVVTKMDKAIGEMKKYNEELAVHSGQHVEINDRLDNLEAIHPDGKHI